MARRVPRALANKTPNSLPKRPYCFGFRSAWIKDEAGHDVAKTLPEGNVFARGNGFIRLVRPSVFERLSAFIDAGVAATPEQEGSNDQ